MGSEGDGTAGEFNGKSMWLGDLIGYVIFLFGSVILIMSKSFRLLTNSLLILIVAILVVGVGT